MEINLIEVLFLIIVLCILFAVLKINRRVKGIKYTLDQLSKQNNIPENPINDELRKLISKGDDTKAEKIAQKTLGLSLLEGKQYVDDLKLEKKSFEVSGIFVKVHKPSYIQKKRTYREFSA